MQTGTKISAIGHVALITVAFFGGVFRAEPLPFEVREVSVISSADYAALTAPRQPPAAQPEATAPAQPDPPDPDPPEVAQPPEPAPEPEIEPAPEPEPVPVRPEPEPIPEPAEPEFAVVPEPAAPPPIDRVAPDPVEQPPEDVTPDDDVKPEVTNDEGADTPQPQQEATAPEAATDRIVTEADTVASLAPTTSLRPPSIRPQPPTPPTTPVAQEEPADEPEPTPDTSNAVNAALAEALAGENPAPAPTPDAPTGPPLSAGEKDALRVAVSNCWNVGSLSSAALATTVVVSVSMTQDGKPVTGSIRMLSSSGGTDASARDAFGAARRAIIRCGSKGFDLPAEKYGQWRDIEMTFNPERMRIK